MKGLMQDFPLTLPHLFRRAELLSFDKEIVTATPDGRVRTTYGTWAERTRRLGGVLDRLGLSPDARVGTFAWNTARHLELYGAVPCSGRVLHTLNVRLPEEHLAYVITHAEDEAIFVERSLVDVLWPVLDALTTVKHVVVMDDDGTGDVPAAGGGQDVHDYEDLLASTDPVAFAVADEHRAAAMCYTSGTTGHPKGVVYSHRSTFLHTMALTSATLMGINEADVILPVVPMFHANGWGLPYAAMAVGATLVLPGRDVSPVAVADLMEHERVTVAAGVPTVWMGVLPELEGRDVSSLRLLPSGGSAVPRVLSEAYRERVGIPLWHSWGMTEGNPVLSSGHLKSTLTAETSEDQRAELRTSAGQPALGVDVRIVDPDTGGPCPWDGEAEGELQAAGPWVAAGYHDDERSDQSFTDDGWLRTGDVATVDRHGYIRIRDRTKDVIKSGGEWISSVDLENAVMSHPKVKEAAVIAVAHPKWQERPLACVVPRDGVELTKEEILAYLEDRVASWWLPDDVVFIDEVPRTSVGKFSKKELRERFADHRLPTS